MKMAINSKNLHYEKNEPAFLRKLRGEHGSDRNNFQAARPKRDRLANDEDDGPTMVDEEGASVSKEDYEAMMNGKKVAAKSNEAGLDDLKDIEGTKDGEIYQDTPTEKQKMAEVGAAKKRKQIKVVGEDLEGGDAVKPKKQKPTKKPKKKVKLSFDEPES
jgi:hypothetical protein